MRRALVPGTFDPITEGHLDVIRRAANMFDEVIVAVAESDKKHPLFNLEERVALAREATASMAGVSVASFEGLLVDFARKMDADAVVKGLRAITDFEYEFQMAAVNHQLDADLEAVFIMSPLRYMYLSSSIVRELASMKGDVSDMVPPCVDRELHARFCY